MDESRTIQIMTKSVQLYEEHLKEQKVLFLHGLAKAVKKAITGKWRILSSVQRDEVAFHRYNIFYT